MKVWIGVDMEGIAGVMHRDHTGPSGRDYETARRWMTDEVNAVVAGAFAGGASEVVVGDGHGNSRSIARDLLDPRARLVSGQFSSLPPNQVQGLDDTFDAAMLVGYHARAGHWPGNLDHTLWSQTVTDVNVNGIAVGEAELVTAYAGAHGVPMLMASGDDVLRDELEQTLPHVTTVVVKRSLGRYQSELVLREEVHQRLRTGAERAMRGVRDAKPFAFASPITLRVTFTHPAFAELGAWVPGAKTVAASVVEYSATEYLAVFNAFTLMCATTGVAFYQQSR